MVIAPAHLVTQNGNVLVGSVFLVHPVGPLWQTRLSKDAFLSPAGGCEHAWVFKSTCVQKFWSFFIFIKNKKLSLSIDTFKLTHTFPLTVRNLMRQNILVLVLIDLNNAEFMLHFKAKFTSNPRLMSLIWMSCKSLQRITLTSSWRLHLPFHLVYMAKN